MVPCRLYCCDCWSVSMPDYLARRAHAIGIDPERAVMIAPTCANRSDRVYPRLGQLGSSCCDACRQLGGSLVRRVASCSDAGRCSSNLLVGTVVIFTTAVEEQHLIHGKPFLLAGDAVSIQPRTPVPVAPLSGIAQLLSACSAACSFRRIRSASYVPSIHT